MICLDVPCWPEPWKRRREPIASLEQLTARLAELDRELFAINQEYSFVNVERDPEDVMSVGLCGEYWVLIHTRYEDEQYYSLGDPDATGASVILDPEGTEMSHRHWIPRSEGVAVLHAWLTGALRHDPGHWTDGEILEE